MRSPGKQLAPEATRFVARYGERPRCLPLWLMEEIKTAASDVDQVEHARTRPRCCGWGSDTGGPHAVPCRALALRYRGLDADRACRGSRRIERLAAGRNRFQRHHRDWYELYAYVASATAIPAGDEGGSD